MARVVKDADVRRKELLDTALSLFEQDGFERTSIDQITAEVGVAKGTFYHYFSSKQDLLEQLVTDWGETLFDRVESELAETDGDAVARMRMLFQRGGGLKLEQRDTSEAFGYALYSDDNLRLRHALMTMWSLRMRSVLAGIIADGIEQGVFHVADAGGTAAALSSLWFGWADQQAERALQLLTDPGELRELTAEVRAVETGMERILGLAEGALGLGLDKLLEQFTEAR